MSVAPVERVCRRGESSSACWFIQMGETIDICNVCRGMGRG